jgi:tRNA(fMet)-specific endonuclease VapC
MNFLLDTNVCSAYMRRPSRLAHRFIQHGGQMATSTVVVAELYAGAYAYDRPQTFLRPIAVLLKNLEILSFDPECSERFGIVKGTFSRRGISFSSLDLMIASVALVHDLTLVTDNVADFRHVPDLRIENWLRP